MKSVSLIFILLLLVVTALQAETIYVNGELGKDDNNGSSPGEKFALKTINKAIILAGKGDKIVVEGKSSSGVEIVYHEVVRIVQGQFGFEITGVNRPILDGDSNPAADISQNAIIIDGDKITVRGFKIINFLADDLDVENISGAAILIGTNTSYHLIEDNIIENCNYGIYVDGATFCEIYGNKISNIKRISSDDSWYDGSGIVIYPSSFGIEGNSIGLKGGNTISDVETYGICLGADSLFKSADLSRINNNTIQNAGESGIALLDVEGIIEIEKNTFTSCKVALTLNGNHFDTFVGSNVFNGSTSDYEIQVSDRYDGALLYDLWKNNENIFKMKTAAAIVPRKMDVLVNKDVGGAIMNNIKKAENIANKGLKLEVIEPTDQTDLIKD